MADLDRIKRNVAKMAEMNAPETDIDGYIASEGVTLEQVRNHKFSQNTETQPTSKPQPVAKEQPTYTGAYADIMNDGSLTKEQKAEAIRKRGEEINKNIDKDLRKDLTKMWAGGVLEIGSAAIPVGAGLKLGGLALKAGKPIAKQVIGNLAKRGAIEGGLSGLVGGIGRGMAEDRDLGGIAQTALTDTAIGTVAGGALGALGGKITTKVGKSGKRIKNIEAKQQIPIAERMTAEQLDRATAPASQYGVKQIDTAQNKAVAKQIQDNISAEESLLKEYKTIRADLVKKYGSVENLKAQAVKDVPDETQYGMVSEALKDYRNLIAYEQELGNAKYVSTNIKPTSTREGVIVENISKTTKAQPVEKVVQQPQIVQKVDDVIPEQVVKATGKTKERGFVDTVRQNYGDDVAKQITDKEYDVYSHEMQKANWENRTPEQKIQALNEVDNINPDVLYGKAQALNQAIQNGEPLNVAMLDGVAKNLTKAGQEIEAAKHFIPTSPEGIVLETIKQTRKNTPKQVLKLKDETSQIVDEVAKTLPKQKTREQQLKAIERILSKRIAKPREQKNLATQLLALNDNNGLTPENFARLIDKHYGIQTIDVSDYAKIQELSERFINATTDRERDVANGLIKKFIWNKQPKKWADKARTYRNINMLLSVPSRLLDVTSTAAFQGVRALDELTAKGLDKIARTGVRGGVENMSPKSWFKSVARGAKEGVEDVNLGINTARSGEVDRYELGFHPQFENVPLLGKAEKGLNATIRVPDRMFYEAKFDSALKDLMSTGKFTAEEAEEIARNEALQAVFQGQGLLSRTSKDVRDWFDNLAPDLRIGSHIAPFVQTPANLVAEGLDRSPLGLTKGIVQWNRATTPQELRAAQETVAKGLTGSIGAVGLGGYALNKLPNNIGGLTNEDLYGDEVRNLPPQSVVIGDKSISLAGAPYFTIPAGMGKALLTPDKSLAEKTLNSIAYTGNILSDLPMYKGLGDLYKGVGNIFKEANEYATGKDNAQGIVGEVGRLVGQQGANVLSQYIPFGGTLGTIRNAADPYNREMMTSNENPLLGTAEYIGNRLQNRIPFASSLLPMKYNTLGKPSMRTNIENPVARIAEATLSPVRIRNYTERPAEMEEMQRIQDYAMENDIDGKTTLKFAKPKRYIGKGKDKLQLTNEEYSELTRLYNGKVFDELQFLMNTPEYQEQNEETQIKWVREVMKEKKKEAEEELFEKFGIIFQ